VAYTIFTFIVFVIGFLLGALVLLRREDYDLPVGTDRVDNAVGQLGKQSETIRKTVGTATGISESLVDGTTESIDTVNRMGTDIQRARELLDRIQKRNEQGDATPETDQ
jgi:hypothetical protein